MIILGTHRSTSDLTKDITTQAALTGMTPSKWSPLWMAANGFQLVSGIITDVNLTQYSDSDVDKCHTLTTGVGDIFNWVFIFRKFLCYTLQSKTLLWLLMENDFNCDT